MFNIIFVSHLPHTSHTRSPSRSPARHSPHVENVPMLILESRENWRTGGCIADSSGCTWAVDIPQLPSPDCRESARSSTQRVAHSHRRRHRGRCESLRSCAAAASRYTAFSCRARPARLPEGGLTRRTTVKIMQTRSAAASAIQVGCIAATRASARAVVARIAATPTRRGGSA